MKDNKKEEDYNLDEDMKKHPGFGKPLPKHLISGDIYSNFINTARNAGYLPPFVAKQKEIRLEMAKLLDLIEKNAADSEVTSLLTDINHKIKKYNTICPPKMQRIIISLEDIEKQYKIWE